MKRAPQAGFTLIELMISLVLFSFAIAGVLSVGVSMMQAFREQRAVVATETSVRAPMDFISDAIRNASPAITTGTIQDVATCTTGAITVTNSTSGPDEISVVYASGAVVTSLRSTYDGVTNTSITVTEASQILVGDVLLITDSTKGHLVTVTSNPNVGIIGSGAIGLAAPGACAQNLPAGGYLPGSLVIRARRARFYVDVAGTVTDGVPTLMVDMVDYSPAKHGPGSPTAEPIAENIEDMQVAVGVDVNGINGIEPGEWEYSAGTGALAGPIRAVRISLIARAPRQLQAGTATFQRPNNEDRVDAAPLDSYRRRVLASTVEIRNLGGSP